MAQAVTVVQHKCLRLPKRGNSMEEFEDAYACNESAGKFAIADGASESICAGEWARLLCETFVSDTSSRAEIGPWLAGAQGRWQKLIVDQPADWHVQEKLRDGAFATFLGVRIESTRHAIGRWRAVAVGDSSLFLVHRDALRGAFPIGSASAFGTRPNLIGSRLHNRVNAAAAHGTLTPGDQLLLMTDALAEWFLAQNEAGQTPWRQLQQLTNDDFANWVDARRKDRSLKNDDVTMVTIEIGE